VEAKGPRIGGITMGFGLVIAVAVVAFLLTYNGVKIVREYQRLAVFRLGRSFGPRGPGIVYLIPIIDKAVWVEWPGPIASQIVRVTGLPERVIGLIRKSRC
jgi:regulator of protease activity HflC (stomatin/prohibitin superfamily)